MGVLYEKNKVKDKALLYYTATTQAAYPKSVKAEGLYRIGLIYQGDNKTDPALEAFTRALAEDPSLSSSA